MAEVNGETAPQTNGHAASSPASQPAPTPAAPTTAPTQFINPSAPLTSLQDDGVKKKPRDARVIHMLLASLGVTGYQDRVPLQILDFAYRHTSSILSDALHLSPDAYASQQQRSKDPPVGGKDVDGQVNMNALHLAIQSRLQYQFHGGNGGGLSKEFLLETAEKRNAQALPRVVRDEWGVRLPSERFVLTGVPWGLKESWETEGEEEEVIGDVDGMVGLEGPEEGGDEGEDGGRMEDIFGEEGGEDVDMAEE